MKRPQAPKRWPARLALLAVLLLLSVLAWQLPAFHLDQIKIAGLQDLSNQEVIAASGLQVGQHLFSGLGGSLEQIIRLRYAAAESRLKKAFPSIRSVCAYMDFPGMIRIDVEERIQVAYLSIPDGCVMVDKEGVAIRILEKAPPGIPVIGGVTATSLILGQPLGVDVPEAMNSAISLMGAIIDADKDTRTALLLLPNISRIRPLSGNHLYLTVILPQTGEELTVEAETGSDMADDMLWLRFALSQDAFKNLGKGVLDLTGSRKTFIPDT
jgi:hypothetical protein